jgi:hypothetical protein
MPAPPDVPRGIRAHDHVEGLTLLFRERHTAGRRGVRLYTAAIVTSLGVVGFGVLAFATVVFLMAATTTLGVEGMLLSLALAAYAGIAILVLALPTLLALLAVVYGAVMYHDAGRTHVHLTVGARGITVERRTEKQTVRFPPHEDLEVGVATSTAYPTLWIRSPGRSVLIPVLGSVHDVEWIAAQVRARCAASGTAAAVPAALQQARQQSA